MNLGQLRRLTVGYPDSIELVVESPDHEYRSAHGQLVKAHEHGDGSGYTEEGGDEETFGPLVSVLAFL